MFAVAHYRLYAYLEELKSWVDANSNQISFIGLMDSKDYYKRPSGVVCEKGHVGVSC